MTTLRYPGGSEQCGLESEGLKGTEPKIESEFYKVRYSSVPKD